MSLTYAYMNELENIQNDSIREFVAEALATAPEFYANLEAAIKETKNALTCVENLLHVLDAEDYASDIVLAATLLQNLTKFELDEEGDVTENTLHPLGVRQSLLTVAKFTSADTFDDIMRTIEASRGFNSPVPQVMPAVTDPVYIWVLPFANALAKAMA